MQPLLYLHTTLPYYKAIFKPSSRVLRQIQHHQQLFRKTSSVPLSHYSPSTAKGTRRCIRVSSSRFSLRGPSPHCPTIDLHLSFQPLLNPEACLPRDQFNRQPKPFSIFPKLPQSLASHNHGFHQHRTHLGSCPRHSPRTGNRAVRRLQGKEDRVRSELPSTDRIFAGWIPKRERRGADLI